MADNAVLESKINARNVGRRLLTVTFILETVLKLPRPKQKRHKHDHEAQQGTARTLYWGVFR